MSERSQQLAVELQQVADSPDSSKRQRGRRGLDMLNRLQGNSTLDIQVVDTDFPAVKEVDLDYAANRVTAMIGPSGCGKSTLARCINRMHEEIAGTTSAGWREP